MMNRIINYKKYLLDVSNFIESKANMDDDEEILDAMDKLWSIFDECYEYVEKKNTIKSNISDIYKHLHAIDDNL